MLARTPSSRGIRATGAVVALAGRPVLRGVDLDVPPGQVTGLVGPSGSGKSTLLRALVRLIELDAGHITLDGADIRELDARRLRRRVGLVPQTPVMLPGTVADNLRHGVPDLQAAELHGALADASLDLTLAARPAVELSGGERTRVALARALTRGPEALLLDEPTAALDPATAEQVGATLRRLCGRGLAVCLTTHDPAFADRWIDRQVTLR